MDFNRLEYYKDVNETMKKDCMIKAYADPAKPRPEELEVEKIYWIETNLIRLEDKYPVRTESNTQRILAALKGSIIRLGILNPLVLNNSLGIISGRLRLQAAKELGMWKVPCRIIYSRNFDLVTFEENITRQNYSLWELWSASKHIIPKLMVIKNTYENVESWHETPELIGRAVEDFSPDYSKNRMHRILPFDTAFKHFGILYSGQYNVYLKEYMEVENFEKHFFISMANISEKAFKYIKPILEYTENSPDGKKFIDRIEERIEGLEAIYEDFKAHLKIMEGLRMDNFKNTPTEPENNPEAPLKTEDYLNSY